MLTIKCPKCATMLKVKPQNVAIQVKCPKCATLLKIGAQKTAPKPTQSPAATSKAAPRQAAKKPAQPAAKRPAQPAAKRPPAAPANPAPANPAPVDLDNPFADLPALDMPGPAVDLGAGGAPAADMGALDFGNVDLPAAAGGGFPAPAAPAAFPAAAAANPYANKAPRKKKKKAEPEEPPKSGKKKKKASSDSGNKKMLWIGLAVGAAVLLVAGVGAFVLMGTSGSASGSAAAVPTPDGYQAGTVGRVKFAFPKGTAKETPPTSIKAKALVSAESGATFFVGVDEYEFLNPSDRQVSLRAGRMIMSNVYGGEEVTRSGHNGFKGRSSGGLDLTNMTVEYYLVDGEVILIGCGMPKKEVPEPTYPLKRNEEPEPPSEPTEEEKAQTAAFEKEMKTFFETVQI